MLESLFVENKKAPKETRIHYTKSNGIFYIIFSILFLGFGIYAFFYLSYLIGIGFIAISVYGIRENRKLIKDTSVQLILSEEGITYKETRIKRWSEIKNEHIIFEPSPTGRKSQYYLSYDHRNRNEKILINELDISPQRVEYLLKIYRKRSAKSVNFDDLH
ncbi:DUF308 domain-containing protein [uncultured Aquimarina sp.]|uniref:DUF308 domain-containing protein n=1 Tax=uncultured Aquimarina sp. TaxID=575652 RepID=UPI002637DEBA|nr:DUF308 domain-containing protein [uncultured Aquimarina sp.]